MKKLFIAALAIAALASCSQSETIDESASAQKAMTFDNAYIGKTTRAVPVTGNAFSEGASIGVVCMQEATNVMANQAVTFTGGAWTYTPVKFYEQDKNYKFDAYYPYDATKTASLTTLESISELYKNYQVKADITKQVDLMYTDGTPKESTWTTSVTPGAIQFKFYHALSQVKFSVATIGDYSGSYTLKVKSLTLKGAKDVGTLNRSTGVWTLGTSTDPSYSMTTPTTFTLSQTMQTITTATNDVFLLLPQKWDAELTVEIVIAVSAGTTLPADPIDINKDYTVTAKIPVPESAAKGWERNHIYNYQLTLNLNDLLNLHPIAFAAPEVEEWSAEEKTEQTVVVPAPANP